jgi:hypothetical protein
MAQVPCGKCRTVAPLIARYNDPDLGEAERVLLSTHLLQCGQCLARLREYRALDQQLRRMSGVTLAPQVREAVLERVAASGPGFGLPAVALVWKQAWVGAAAAISLTALVFAFGLASFGAAQQTAGTAPGPSAAGDIFARSLPTTILISSNSTQVVSAVGESFSGTVGAYNLRVGNVGTVRATVREVHAREGRLVVMFEGARNEEGLYVNDDTRVVWSDGRQGSLSDIATGTSVQVERDQNTAVARKITLTGTR